MKSFLTILLTLTLTLTASAARQIPNVETSIQSSDDASSNIRYADLLTAVAKAQAPGGLTVDEMRTRLRIIDAAERAGDVIVLEDADYDAAVRMVKAHRWGVPHVAIVAFVDAVLGARAVNLSAAPPEPEPAS